MPQVTLPDGSTRTFASPLTVADVAASIGAGLAKAALAGKVDGQLVDTSHLIQSDSRLAIITAKDADGLHTLNLGHLLKGEPGPRSCTPAGVMALLAAAGVELAGQRAVVVGRSILVGQPMALMLQAANATVSIAHSRTADLAELTRQADVLVVAAGRPRMIGAEHVKPGAVVVDVGIHRLEGEAGGKARLGRGEVGRFAEFIDLGRTLERLAHGVEVAGEAGVELVEREEREAALGAHLALPTAAHAGLPSGSFCTRPTAWAAIRAAFIASSPLLPLDGMSLVPPARACACSIDWQVSTPNATGLPVEAVMAASPAASTPTERG